MSAEQDLSKAATPASLGSTGSRASAGASQRSAAQIRADIGVQQRELTGSMEALRSRVNELTDWRRQVREHRTQLITGAAIAGFVVGGIVAVMRRR